MKKLLLLPIFMISLGQIFAQNIVSIDTNPVSVAQGSNGVSSAPSGVSIYGNTAAIAFSDNVLGVVAYSFMPYLTNLQKGNSIHTAAGYYKLNGIHSVAVGVRYFDKTNVTLLDENNSNSGVAKPNEMSADLGYAMKLNDKMSVALNARLLTSNTGVSEFNTGTSFGVDLGYYYVADRITAGAVISNIGSKISFGGDSYDTPCWIKLGAGYQYPLEEKHTVKGSLQVDYSLKPQSETGLEVGVGAEYVYDNMIAVRGGFRSASSTLGYSYATAGVGAYLGRASINLACILAKKSEPLHKTMILSAEYRF